MNDNEILPEKKQPDPPGLDIIAYLFKRISALENRIDELESKNAVSAERESVLILKADSAEKKLDLLIRQMENLAGGIEDIGKSEPAKPQSAPVTQNASRQVAVFIDGENISHKKAANIMDKAKNRGNIELVRVYGIQNNNSDKPWVKTSAELGIKHIRLAGGSKKNKVDKKMFDEILNEAKKAKHADTIIIATNDTDFIPTIKDIRSKGVRVIIMDLKSSLSDKMKNACDSFIYL